jgi:hypothetical protein
VEAKEPRFVKEIDLKSCHPGDTFRLELGGNPLERKLLITIEDPHEGVIQLQRQSGLIMRVTVGGDIIEVEKSFVVKVGPGGSRDGHARLGYVYSIVRAGTVKLGGANLQKTENGAAKKGM